MTMVVRGTTLVYHFEEGKCAHRILRFAQNDRVEALGNDGAGGCEVNGRAKCGSVVLLRRVGVSRGDTVLRSSTVILGWDSLRGVTFFLKKVPKETLFGVVIR